MIRSQLPLSAWSMRWRQLAQASGIAPHERILVALSGGADSVLLLHLLAAAQPRPTLLAVHVDHGLRGAASRADADFCRNLCNALGIPIVLRQVELDAQAPGSLEARARLERYGVLIEEARRTSHTTIVTGHHSDDALETLLQRWMRGTRPEGLRGPRRDLELGAEKDVRIVRPLLSMRREEVRRLLTDRGLVWREDHSNEDRRFTRNRIRHSLLPLLEGWCGQEGVENLRAFGEAVESLEDHLAAKTAHLAWREATYARITRGPRERGLGGVLERGALMSLPAPLRRRALWRLLTEGTGRAPGARLEATILAELGRGRCTRFSLPGEWVLLLRSQEIHLLPPRKPVQTGEQATREHQAWLPFSEEFQERALAQLEPAGRELPAPGIVTLADGRRVSAEELLPGTAPAPTSDPFEAQIQWAPGDGALQVRSPRPGDRFFPLGAPGSRPLTRFLADRGIPREERASCLLVCVGAEIAWVVGLGPAERFRVRSASAPRVRLCLHEPGLPEVLGPAALRA